MRVTSRRAPWRNPALAPAYAAAIAFGAVGLAGLLVDLDPTSTAPPPPEVTISVEVTPSTKAGPARVCVSPPDGWQFADPTPAPTPTPTATGSPAIPPDLADEGAGAGDAGAITTTKSAQGGNCLSLDRAGEVPMRLRINTK